MRKTLQKHHKQYLKKLGENIRWVRKEKGYSMEALANEADIEYRQLGRIERGEINTTIGSLFHLSETLNVNIDSFFHFDNH